MVCEGMAATQQQRKPLWMRLFSCCATDDTEAPMDASIKGGQAFELLYRGDASSSGPSDEEGEEVVVRSRDASPGMAWANGRIGASRDGPNSLEDELADAEMPLRPSLIRRMSEDEGLERASISLGRLGDDAHAEV